MNLRTTLGVARKDLIDSLRNARLLVIVLMPIGLSILYGYLFRETLTETEIVLYSPEETALIGSLSATENVSLFIVDSAEDVERKVEGDNVPLGIILSAGFDAALQSGEQPEIKMIFYDDPESVAGFQRVLMQTIEDLSDRPPVVKVVTRTLHPQRDDEAAPGDEAIFAFFQDVELQSYFIVIWVMMAVTMNGSFLVPTLLVEEKDRRTLAAILVTPAGYVDVVTGKMLVGLIYSLVSSALIMLLNDGFAGDPAFSIAMVILISITMTLIGLLIGGLIENMSTLNTWGSFIMLPLILPGILAGVPLQGASPFFTIPLQLIPTFQLVRGLALGLTGKGVQAWPNIAVLVIESLILFGLVIWSLRRREA